MIEAMAKHLANEALVVALETERVAAEAQLGHDCELVRRAAVAAARALQEAFNWNCPPYVHHGCQGKHQTSIAWDYDQSARDLRRIFHDVPDAVEILDHLLILLELENAT